jgi:hypothetical protein
LPFGILHVLFSCFCAALSRDANMERPDQKPGPSPEGNAQHGSPVHAGRMERAAALTGPAGRPMIASGYEKAGRGRMNSLLPNGMECVPALPAIILRSGRSPWDNGCAAGGNSGPAVNRPLASHPLTTAVLRPGLCGVSGDGCYRMSRGGMAGFSELATTEAKAGARDQGRILTGGLFVFRIDGLTN